MKRWLSFVKRHVTPGTWARPAKRRRPITIFSQITTSRETGPALSHTSSDTYVPAPPSSVISPQPVRAPLCDVDLIMSRYKDWRQPSPILYVAPVPRPDSQALPICDIAVPPQAFVDHAFIHFEPTYKVTVSEVCPHQLELRKPRYERLRKAVSFIPGVSDGEFRAGPHVHFEE